MKIISLSPAVILYYNFSRQYTCSMVMGHWDIVSWWQLKLRFIVPLVFPFFLKYVLSVCLLLTQIEKLLNI